MFSYSLLSTGIITKKRILQVYPAPKIIQSVFRDKLIAITEDPGMTHRVHLAKFQLNALSDLDLLEGAIDDLASQFHPII